MKKVRKIISSIVSVIMMICYNIGVLADWIPLDPEAIAEQQKYLAAFEKLEEWSPIIILLIIGVVIISIIIISIYMGSTNRKNKLQKNNENTNNVDDAQ